MKFKKIEIQAFRAFDKVQDGTFDFETSDGNNADFISLYAPNGFGKTSFYDAVEYGITNNIHRFLKRPTVSRETAKSERIISSSDKQFILRNKFSSEDLDSYVKLYTTESTIPIERKIFKPLHKGGCDFKFNPTDTKHKEFQNVILSQELIDAFLKEDTATGRYEIFINHFGDKKNDEYYRKLVDLMSLNQKRIDELKKDINIITKELDFDGDKNVLKKVNVQINVLKNEGEKLNSIEDSFSEIDELNLTNYISERISDINYGKIKDEELVNFIDIIIIGNEEFIGVSTYFDSIDKLVHVNINELEFKSLYGKYEDRDRIISEIDFVIKNNNEFYAKKVFLEELKKEFESFRKILSEITKIKKNTKNLNADINIAEKDLANSKKLEYELNIQINSLQNQISIIEKKINELPQLKINIENTSLQMKNMQTRLNELNIKIEENYKLKNIIESSVKVLKLAIDQVSVGSYSSVIDDVYSQNEILIKELLLDANELQMEIKKLSEINIKLTEQESFQREIEQFISKGSEIIRKNQSTSCPLCCQEFQSYYILAERVSNNKLLSNLYSKLLIERNEKEQIIYQLNERIKATKDKLLSLMVNDLTSKQNNISNITSIYSKYIDEKKEIETYIEKLNDWTNEVNIYLNSQSIDNNERIFKGQLTDFKLELSKYFTQFEILKSKNAKDLEKIEILQMNIPLLDQDKINLEKNSLFIRTINYFNEYHPNNEISLSVIDDDLHELSDNLNRNINLDKKLRQDKLILDEIFKDKSKGYIVDKLTLLHTTKNQLQQIIISFEHTVNSIFDISPKDHNKKTLIELLNKKMKEIQVQISRKEILIKEFNLLSIYKENVTPYLKYEKAVQCKNKKNARVDFLQKKIAIELETEKNKVADYINGQINIFFYEGLINDLYKRIDPHPEYKNIKFVCDFKEDKPKLNVCISQKGSDDYIIPSLYFSTAQLNILSLSIFLAKALNAKDARGNPIDCILIDDPIQSMDSINILSTIDLLRSIVVNQKKQIILSTHDENFHNLLKKKIPSGLFKSKFMELETYGKVKQ